MRTPTARIRQNLPVAGYSSKDTAKKLGIKPGGVLILQGAPSGWTINDLPDRVRVVRLANASAKGASVPSAVVVAFFRAADEIESRIGELAASIFPAGSLWVAWPRRGGGHESDITDNTMRSHALPIGLVDNKVAAIDEDWSGLRLVWRRDRRV
jgi:hypothetical protein